MAKDYISEADIENKFVNWATENELIALKLNLSGRRGFPDRLVLGWNRKHVFIEFKKPGESATKLQLHVHKILTRRGFKTGIVDSFEDAQHLCRRYILNEY